MRKTTLLSFMLFTLLAFGQNQKVQYTNSPNSARPNNVQNVNAITSITATIPYQGYDETAPYLGQGEYEIFADNVGGVIDKPIILLDGFDPNDSRDIPSIYGLLDYGAGQNLANDLRNLGYDIVILNFPNYTRPATSTLVSGGSDYIQRNAMILVELLNQINALKVGTEKNVVIGPSMGGLIARYGLRYMEMNSLNPDTRLYISFDAPHNGANIPIGFQHLFNYMAYGPLGDATVQVLVDAMLKSTASREMLIDQYEGHLQSGNPTEFDPAILLPTGKPSFRTAFQSELDAMGFPQNIRNVAIANGAGNGSMNGTPGMVVMDHTFDVTSTQRAIINLHFTPLANQTTQVSRFRGQANVFGFWITAYESAASSKAPTDTDGLDSAPGGKFDITSLAGLAGSNALLTEFFDNLDIDYFDFVPTNSSLAISGTQNLYTPVTGSSTTPFAAYYVPTANENHVTLTTANMAFALNEILNPPLALAQNAFPVLQVQNPVEDAVNLFTPKVISNASVSIADISGKIVFSKNNLTIEGNYQIPVSISSGMYFLNIKNSEGNMTKKLVKN
ncbi:MAG TPA: T9SS type A sorting domain-containing protein [Flavobacterium sp.]|nr:T9SS type A sorting domain-containing protein [Flavobacterium sp.]